MYNSLIHFLREEARLNALKEIAKREKRNRNFHCRRTFNATKQAIKLNIRNNRTKHK